MPSRAASDLDDARTGEIQQAMKGREIGPLGSNRLAFALAADEAGGPGYRAGKGEPNRLRLRLGPAKRPSARRRGR